MVQINSVRTDKLTSKTETNTRYYISSIKQDAKTFNRNIRAHWGIENKLHWILDVNFKEDSSRRRKGNSPENFNLISKIAINLLVQHPDKESKNGKRMKAAFSDEYREEILGI